MKKYNPFDYYYRKPEQSYREYFDSLKEHLSYIDVGLTILSRKPWKFEGPVFGGGTSYTSFMARKVVPLVSELTKELLGESIPRIEVKEILRNYGRDFEQIAIQLANKATHNNYHFFEGTEWILPPPLGISIDAVESEIELKIEIHRKRRVEVINQLADRFYRDAETVQTSAEVMTKSKYHFKGPKIQIAEIVHAILETGEIHYYESDSYGVIENRLYQDLLEYFNVKFDQCDFAKDTSTILKRKSPVAKLLTKTAEKLESRAFGSKKQR